MDRMDLIVLLCAAIALLAVCVVRQARWRDAGIFFCLASSGIRALESLVDRPPISRTGALRWIALIPRQRFRRGGRTLCKTREGRGTFDRAMPSARGRGRAWALTLAGGVAALPLPALAWARQSLVSKGLARLKGKPNSEAAFSG